MLNILKKNQLVIFAIAFMLVTIGYMSYSMNTEKVAQTSVKEEMEQAGIGDARLVSNNNVIISEEEEASVNNNVEQKEKVSNEMDNYFNQSRLDREKMYSEMLESYQEILANPNVSQEQKSSAQDGITKVNSQRNSIMIAENLIKNKGFQDIIVFVNNESVSAVVRSDNLETADIAQIQSIIQRELNINVENIHISNK